VPVCTRVYGQCLYRRSCQSLPRDGSRDRPRSARPDWPVMQFDRTGRAWRTGAGRQGRSCLGPTSDSGAIPALGL